MLVSVIIPIYNVKDYLNRCVDSIINQTYGNLEIILVNDGSTDGCSEICDTYKELYPNLVKVIHKQNGGLSDARNFGIDQATGSYITFVDSDDTIAPDMIETLISLATEKDVDIAVCQALRIDENDAVTGIYSSCKEDICLHSKYECMKRFVATEEVGTVAWAKLYRRDLFKDIRFPVGRYHEDVFTTYKVIALCDSMAITQKRLYNYRIRPQSIMQSSFSAKHLDGVYGHIEKYEFLSKNYPDLAQIAESGIVYAADQCVLRMGRSHCTDEKYLAVLRPVYRKHFNAYLKGTSSVAAKCFALCASINLNLITKLISLCSK